MGWYEHPKHKGVKVGDDAFDVTHTFLVDLAELYRAELDRHPTLAELTTLLGIGLRVSGSGLIEDLAEEQVTELVAKTKKKPRDQTFAVGDIFAIPLRAKFAFGRIMANTNRGLLVEIFRETRVTAVAPLFKGKVARLFPPIFLSSRAFKTWRWTIVRSEPGYKMPAERLEFAGRGPDGWCIVNLKGDRVRLIDAVNAKAIEGDHMWDPQMLEKRIHTLLAGRPSTK